jgi:D-amino peptidase
MGEMKIYVSVDFEGAACVVGQPGKTLSELPEWQYREVQRIVTGEANAAVEGCLQGGATDIILDDCHNGGHQLLHDQLHPEAKVLLGSLRPRRFWPLDGSFAGLMLVAYHAMAGTLHGILSHSYSSVDIQHMWLNGNRIGEMGFDAALAGTLGVPTVMVSSDAAGCREAQELLGDVETVITKWGISRNAALSLSVVKAREAITAGARRACERIGDFKPFIVKPPYELKVEYKLESSVDGQRGGERVDERTYLRRSGNLFDLI